MIIIGIILIPFLSGLILGIIGAKPWASQFNILSSLLTAILSLLLLYEVNLNGPMMALGKWFYIDSFNIFIVFLTSFIGLTTAIFSGPYMKNEVAHKNL